MAVHAALLDYVADGRITPTAGFLYVVLLKYHNRKRADDSVWPSRRALAQALGLRRVDSVDTHLKGLRDAGLVSWTERRVGSMKASNRYELHLIVGGGTPANRVSGRPAQTGVSAGEGVPLKTAYRYPVQRGPDTRSTGDELDEEELHQDEQDPTEDWERSAPPSFASLTQSAASEENSINTDEQGFDDWRSDDRNLFKSFVGEKLRTNGERWGKDGQVYTADAFYNAYRAKADKKLRWPGRFLSKMVDDGRDVEDWLIDQGLETAS